MIVTEFYRTREDGVNLVRTYSDIHRYIRRDETGAIYEEAVDPEDSGRTYTETEDEIVDPEEEIQEHPLP